ncbi:YciK family oxidoreductase [Motilimonas sp. 1_MG-2023]|uniref:YciK family oxidoreductase n=1 Tax=Motilimonas sp. 1_MG-2023 TaxID=3062672 RepID=UPI0026E312CD|nr:YciK family oxidoreductase [Motilimonas sp. 1_MG-2023]MDO6526299.1 YciK family oxidoreductase [Motilimonas sp. 1_MG-2023]
MEYQAPQDLLANKTILVTGAGSGIGKEIALTYAKYGARVILLGRTVAKLEAVYDEIEALGAPQPAIIPMDLKGATEQHYQDMAETIAGQFGHLDGLVHNAGALGVLGPFHQIGQDMWDEVMQVNVKSQFLMTKHLLPVLKEATAASIIFTSSSVGRQGRAYWGVYTISKFATEGMMQTLASELDGSHVRANCINPGATHTPMRSKAYPAEDADLLKRPADIMPTYLYLMGSDSSAVNGQSLNAQ